MKIIITKSMVEVENTKYIAIDGKEFESEYECQMYEKRKNRDQLEMDYKRLVVCNFKIPYTDWNTDAFGVEAVRLNSEADYYTVKAYWMGDYCDADFEKPKEYPCIKVIAGDENYATFSSWTTDDVVYHLARAYESAIKQLKANNVNVKEAI